MMQIVSQGRGKPVSSRKQMELQTLESGWIEIEGKDSPKGPDIPPEYLESSQPVWGPRPNILETEGPRGPVDYIRKTIPKFRLPNYKGNRRKQLVPHTLDLQERAELCVNALTSPTDPVYDHEMYFGVTLFTDPESGWNEPAMYHDLSDICQCKFIEGLPLMRLASGSRQNLHVERAWLKALLKSVGPDGLIYTPLHGRPWSRYGWLWCDPTWRGNGQRLSFMDLSIKQFACPFTVARLVGAMSIYYSLDHDPIWQETIEKAVDALSRLAVHKEDYAYLVAGVYEPGAMPADDFPLPLDIDASFLGWVIQGLTQCYRVTGYAPARDLAGRFVVYLKDHSLWFDDQGRFTTQNLDPWFDRAHPVKGDLVVGGHFHHHSICLLGMVDYGLAVGDNDLVRYVKMSYDWAKTQGNSLVGFFPENIVPDFPTSEICEVADMLGTALKLAEAGYDDCWDDADRWLRNQFAENQLLQCDWIDRIPPGPPREDERLPDWQRHRWSTSERVGERNIGAFAGWSSGSDWVYRMGIMHCCTGNAARALYYAWKRILDYEKGSLKVNLLLNRASECVDVNSHIPYEGRVDLMIKAPCEAVSVRAPQWIDAGSDSVVCTVNGKPREVSWNGRYVNVGQASRGDAISVSFPISERTVCERIGGVDYTLVIKGNTVVLIDPPGKYCPLYQRDHYRQNDTLWIKKERFIPAQEIQW